MGDTKLVVTPNEPLKIPITIPMKTQRSVLINEPILAIMNLLDSVQKPGQDASEDS